MRLDILVPKECSALRRIIQPGAAIVGHYQNNLYLIDLEENRQELEQLATYDNRLLHAAGRAASNFPTPNRRPANPLEFVVVGSYESEGWQAVFFNTPRERATLEAWKEA